MRESRFRTEETRSDAPGPVDLADTKLDARGAGLQFFHVRRVGWRTRARLMLVLCAVLYELCGCFSSAVQNTPPPYQYAAVTTPRLTPPPSNPLQEGIVTSTPDGATIYVANEIMGISFSDRSTLRVTPADFSIAQKNGETNWLIAKLDGYERERWRIPRKGPVSHHFMLERDFSLQIKDEKASYTKDYMKAALSVVGKSDKALNSPRMFLASVVAEAVSEYDKLRVDYSDYANSALNRALRRLFVKWRDILSLEDEANLYLRLGGASAGAELRREVRGRQDIIAKELSELTAKIRAGLGIYE